MQKVENLLTYRVSQNTGNNKNYIILAILNGFLPMLFAGFFCHVHSEKNKWWTKNLVAEQLYTHFCVSVYSRLYFEVPCELWDRSHRYLKAIHGTGPIEVSEHHMGPVPYILQN